MLKYEFNQVNFAPSYLCHVFDRGVMCPCCRPGAKTQLCVAVAYALQHEAVVSRAVNRTLSALTADLASAGLVLTPIYNPLPPSFSPKQLGELCASWAGKNVVAVLVFATEEPGLMPALAAAASQLPVIWTTGEVNGGYLSRVSTE